MLNIYCSVLCEIFKAKKTVFIRMRPIQYCWPSISTTKNHRNMTLKLKSLWAIFPGENIQHNTEMFLWQLDMPETVSGIDEKIARLVLCRLNYWIGSPVKMAKMQKKILSMDHCTTRTMPFNGPTTLHFSWQP